MIYGYDTVSIIGNDVNYRDLVIVDDGSRKETSRTSSTWIQNSMICPVVIIQIVWQNIIITNGIVFCADGKIVDL